jgi:hypothetical protein
VILYVAYGILWGLFAQEWTKRHEYNLSAYIFFGVLLSLGMACIDLIVRVHVDGWRVATDILALLIAPVVLVVFKKGLTG